MGTGPDGRPVRKHVTAPTQAAVTRKVRELEKAGSDGAGITGSARVALAAYLESWIAARVSLASV
jgi:hypothetical protein